MYHIFLQNKKSICLNFLATSVQYFVKDMDLNSLFIKLYVMKQWYVSSKTLIVKLIHLPPCISAAPCWHAAVLETKI